MSFQELSALVQVRRIARSGLFDASFYEIARPDSGGMKPLLHFCLTGAAEGLRPNLYFDPRWYSWLYLADDVRRPNPLSHYIRVGEAKELSPSPSFEPAWYRLRYGLAQGVSPLAHYIAQRRTQRFSPNRFFDVEAYLARYGEEIGPNRDPYAHFLRHGWRQGVDPGPEFDSDAYRARAMTGTPGERPDGSAWLAQEMRVPLIHHLRELAEADALQRCG